MAKLQNNHGTPKQKADGLDFQFVRLLLKASFLRFELSYPF